MIYHIEDFPFLKPIVDRFSLLKPEMDAANLWVPWGGDTPEYEQCPVKFVEGGWNLSPIYLENANPEDMLAHGMNPKLAPMASQLPKAYPRFEALMRRIPEVYGAVLSRLRPHTVLNTHSHPKDRYLRLHVGYQIPPDGLSGIQVGDETHIWRQEGEAIILDGRFPHSAWNKSDEERIVLYVGFYPPEDYEGPWPGWDVDPCREKEL